MLETSTPALTAEKVIDFMGAEVDLNAEFLQFKKKRTIDVYKSHEINDYWTPDLTVYFRAFQNESGIVNEAEVFLLPEELPIFTQALIEHPILFPTNYSQYLTKERGLYCIQLLSVEPVENFVERLSAALCRLE